MEINSSTSQLSESDLEQLLLQEQEILDIDTNEDIDFSAIQEEFIKKELIVFSKYDCARSIPNIMDGFKISNRKILYVSASLDAIYPHYKDHKH